MSRCLEVGHLRDDWVMRADGIHALMKETPRAPSSLLPCEDTGRRWLSVHQEAAPHQTRNLLVP